MSFRVKTTKLRPFYGSRQKDEVVGNENREKDGQGDGAYLMTQLSLSAHLLARESRNIKNSMRKRLIATESDIFGLLCIIKPYVIKDKNVDFGYALLSTCSASERP